MSYFFSLFSPCFDIFLFDCSFLGAIKLVLTVEYTDGVYSQINITNNIWRKKPCPQYPLTRKARAERALHLGPHAPRNKLFFQSSTKITMRKFTAAVLLRGEGRTF